MLTIDNLREIAYQADYVETKNMIKEFPELNNNDFWKLKCLTLFPKQKYLDFYTGEENYLIRKRGEFALAVEFSDDCDCSNILFEYFDMLEEVLELSSDKIDYGKGYDIHNFYKITLQKQFIVINNNNFLEQYENELEALEIIKEDSIIHKNDKYINSVKYMIIDLKSITPYFWKLGSLSEKRKSIFKVYEFEDILRL